MKSILYLVFFCLYTVFLFSQNGPGGVGNTNGTSSLVLWLRANDLTLSNGANVSSWSDASGYGNNASAVSGNEPQFYTNVLNGQPTIRFTASNSDYLRINDATSLKPNNISVFLVGRYNSSTNSWGAFLIKTNNWSWPNGYGVARNNNFNQIYAFINQWNGTNNFNSTNLSTATFAIVGHIHNGSNLTLYLNETNVGLKNNSGNITNSNNFLYIGINPDAAGTGVQNPLDGDIAEVIILNTGANTTQRIMIHNYLSAKYNILLSANDLYDEDDATNGNYDFQVAGIGQTSATDNQTIASSSIVTMHNPSALNNGDYLLFGHDNGSLTSNFSDVPSGISFRLNRVWRVSEVNEVGNVDIDFNLTGLGTFSASDLHLLIDTDNDGVFSDETPISGATSLGGNSFQFSNISGINNNLRFTLGFTSSFPLSLTASSFTAQPIPGGVLLKWKTENETDIVRFEAERSEDGTHWYLVQQVNPVGGGSNQYEVKDFAPAKGNNFYRIKVILTNGRHYYSEVRKIYFGGTTYLQAWPNPATDVITISIAENSTLPIRIFNAEGKEVTRLVTTAYMNSGYVRLHIRLLPPGVYFVVSGRNKIKFIKE